MIYQSNFWWKGTQWNRSKNLGECKSTLSNWCTKLKWKLKFPRDVTESWNIFWYYKQTWRNYINWIVNIIVSWYPQIHIMTFHSSLSWRNSPPIHRSFSPMTPWNQMIQLFTCAPFIAFIKILRLLAMFLISPSRVLFCTSEVWICVWVSLYVLLRIVLCWCC